MSVLLFVFWYCHKRGREVRLENEKLAAGGTASDGASISSLEASTIGDEEPGTAAIRENADAERLQKVLDQPAPAKVPLPPSTQKP
jgi:hypothetical protein